VPMPRSGSSRRGWLVTSYAGAAAFFALEAVAREPGEASDLAATGSDQGTTWQIGAAYGLAAGIVAGTETTAGWPAATDEKAHSLHLVTIL
jgi:hypothetical protein